MATKTVVCPECGSAVASGRYACSECGALLASVAVAPRRSAPARVDDDARAGEQVADAIANGEAAAGDVGTGAADGEAEHAANPQVEAADVARAGAGPAADPDAELTDAPPTSAAEPPADFDDDAPLESSEPVPVAFTPTVLHDLADDPDGSALAAGAALAAEAAPAAALEAPAASAAAADVTFDRNPEDVRAAAVVAPVAPAWPPPGDRGAVPRPEPRTPAGAYLPPSAVLPPLDGPGINSAALAGAAVSATASSGTVDSSVATWASRGSAALTGALAPVRVSGDSSRSAVGAGAGLAAIGFLLPWINALPDAGPFALYLDRWGLAGSGSWLIVLGLLGLASAALGSGRATSWPVGLSAIVVAAFLVGLLWPYLVGRGGRSIGVLVVLVGAIVMAIAGLLNQRSRHDPSDADVSPVNGGGR